MFSSTTTNQTNDLASLLPDLIPFCPFTLQSYPKAFIRQCQALPYDWLAAWAMEDDRHFVELDAGGLYMRFPKSGDGPLADYRRIRIEELLEEPFDEDGELKDEYKSKVYKPILLTQRDPSGDRVMLLDKGQRVKFFKQPWFPEWAAPQAEAADV